LGTTSHKGREDFVQCQIIRPWFDSLVGKQLQSRRAVIYDRRHFRSIDSNVQQSQSVRSEHELAKWHDQPPYVGSQVVYVGMPHNTTFMQDGDCIGNGFHFCQQV
jgi:hypothetical protein